jgi:hypothetical protein
MQVVPLQRNRRDQIYYQQHYHHIRIEWSVDYQYNQIGLTEVEEEEVDMQG